MLLFFIFSTLASEFLFSYIGVPPSCLLSLVYPSLKIPYPIPFHPLHPTTSHSALPDSSCSLPFSSSLLMFSVLHISVLPSLTRPVPQLPFATSTSVKPLRTELWSIATMMGLHLFIAWPQSRDLLPLPPECQHHRWVPPRSYESSQQPEDNLID